MKELNNFEQYFLHIQESVEDKRGLNLYLHNIKNIRILSEEGNKSIDTLSIVKGRDTEKSIKGD